MTTTDSDHALEIYMNLARRMTLNGVDQLWVADITYIRLKSEWVYLALILDGFSRKVVGWKLDRTLASRLASAALEMAMAKRRPLPGLVHHSDRGIQYASAEYVAILQQYGMVPSMSRPANPYDNASCESFIKTLKREEIYANDYEDLEHLHSNLEEFIERYYNQKRLHSALGYRSPDEFEEQSRQEGRVTTVGATVRFCSGLGSKDHHISRVSATITHAGSHSGQPDEAECGYGLPRCLAIAVCGNHHGQAGAAAGKSFGFTVYITDWTTNQQVKVRLPTTLGSCWRVNPVANDVGVRVCLRNQTGSRGSVPTNG